MGRRRIAILTSSRADYGIYKPLLNALQKDEFFEFEIIAFGTHLSQFHSYTLQNIINDGFEVKHTVETMLLTDTSESISAAMGLTMLKFSTLWASLKGKIDLILCLGDRYEMFAAVLASVPFQIPVAHLHGGETTLGAIDNVFRHSITLASQLHFTSTEKNKAKVIELLGNENTENNTHHVYNVGALSLDNLHEISLLNLIEFYNKYQIDLQKPTILLTFHPETVNFEINVTYIDNLLASLDILQNTYQVIITMPNADTAGNMIRQKLLTWADNKTTAFIVENFGTLGYFSAMKHCSFLLGNTSSGIIEAASFGKYVINLGDRQKGRETGNNVLQIPIEKDKILGAVQQIENLPILSNYNIYGDGNTTQKILKIWKTLWF